MSLFSAAGLSTSDLVLIQRGHGSSRVAPDHIYTMAFPMPKQTEPLVPPNQAGALEFRSGRVSKVVTVDLSHPLSTTLSCAPPRTLGSPSRRPVVCNQDELPSFH
jgi:hypothetical protein